MAVKEVDVAVNGIAPLLMNNPQTVDRFNKYAKRMSHINAKKTKRTDEDYHELGNIEIRSKIYHNEELGVYVPARWLMAAICKVSNKIAKIPKADIRSAVFPTEEKLELSYDKKELVKTPDDIVGNEFFRHKMILPQGTVRLVKHAPIFHNWSFNTRLEFDDAILDASDLVRIIDYCAFRGGFGDFRPTFGRAEANVTVL